ncbi:MAG: hypothetical protein DDG59_13485 [Anaerolineae bacterium]|nr:MAG: hypothetical protein DDG59_13485 [Anaerolineae bacterium]
MNVAARMIYLVDSGDMNVAARMIYLVDLDDMNVAARMNCVTSVIKLQLRGLVLTSNLKTLDYLRFWQDEPCYNLFRLP